MAISAAQKTIHEVLSPRHYQFVIPAYQRPYAWGKEQALALINDLRDAFLDSPNDEYFLGSIVVVKRSASSAEAEVVDGQQRLTSLSILMAVIRDLLPLGSGSDVTNLLVSSFMDTREIGLRLRTTGKNPDDLFFDHYIRSEEGFRQLLTLCAALPSSQQCIVRNALVMREVIVKWLDGETEASASVLKRFLSYLCQKGCLVVVESTDFNSAYRIFSTMNNRGLALGVSDLIKALVLEQFQDDYLRDSITETWEQEEADLTRLARSESDDLAESRRYFELLFSHIYRIKAKRRSSKNLFDDFRKDVFGVSAQASDFGPDRAREFVQDLLVPYSDAYEVILSKSVQIPDQNSQRLVNQLYLPLLENINNSDWQPVAILYLSRYCHQLAQAHEFFRLLERVAAVSLVLGENVTKRANRYAPILRALDDSQQDALVSLQNSVTPEERSAFLHVLSSDLYGETHAFYVMLRLDSALAEGGISSSLSAPRASIEHVAPQTLKQEWKDDWPDDDHRQLVNKIGNLVLLSKRKNSRAQNFDFKTKKDAYFAAKDGKAGEVATFPLVTRVLKAGNSWTPGTVRQNQEDYLSQLMQVWHLA
jgi:hypothetical protein